MYSGVHDSSVVPSEDYLLGLRKFDQPPINPAPKVSKISSAAAWKGPLSDSACIKKSNLDALRREDPLSSIRNQEDILIHKIVSNPMKRSLEVQSRNIKPNSNSESDTKNAKQSSIKSRYNRDRWGYIDWNRHLREYISAYLVINNRLIRWLLSPQTENIAKIIVTTHITTRAWTRLYPETKAIYNYSPKMESVFDEDFEPDSGSLRKGVKSIRYMETKDDLNTRYNMKLAIALSLSEKDFSGRKQVKLSKHNMSTILPAEEAIKLAISRANEALVSWDI